MLDNVHNDLIKAQKKNHNVIYNTLVVYDLFPVFRVSLEDFLLAGRCFTFLTVFGVFPVGCWVANPYKYV